jgi:hypothetical protein
MTATMHNVAQCADVDAQHDASVRERLPLDPNNVVAVTSLQERAGVAVTCHGDLAPKGKDQP